MKPFFLLRLAVFALLATVIWDIMSCAPFVVGVLIFPCVFLYWSVVEDVMDNLDVLYAPFYILVALAVVLLEYWLDHNPFNTPREPGLGRRGRD